MTLPATLATQIRGRPELPVPVSLGLQMYSRLRKFVTLFMLIWALADLSVPGLCQTDFQDFRAPQAISVSAQSTVSHQQQSQSSVEDDCFCCCSHIVASNPVALNALSTGIADWPTYVVAKPREYSSSLYRPPRS